MTVDQSSNAATTDEYTLADPSAINPFTPKYITHCKISMSATGKNLQFFYNNTMPDTAAGTSIDQYLKGLIPPSADPLVDFLIDRRPSPLDVEIMSPGYVIFELDPSWNWQLRTDAGGVTTKDDLGDRYFDLRHVTETGTILNGNQTNSAKCRIAYFSARVPTTADKTSDDYINLHIEFPHQDGDTVLSIKIDPDIKNNGGQGLGG